MKNIISLSDGKVTIDMNSVNSVNSDDKDKTTIKVNNYLITIEKY